jgi:hypothetical protein
MAIRVAEQRVEGGKVGREFRIAAAARMFEEELARGAGENRQQLDQIAPGAFERVPQGESRLNVKGMLDRRFVASSSASMSAPISR